MTEKFNDLASKLAKGSPKGLGFGITVFAGATAAIYGIYKSLFTGRNCDDICYLFFSSCCCCCCISVEGGHRAIIFSRLGGIDPHTILSEGLHFRLVL